MGQSSSALRRPPSDRADPEIPRDAANSGLRRRRSTADTRSERYKRPRPHVGATVGQAGSESDVASSASNERNPSAIQRLRDTLTFSRRAAPPSDSGTWNAVADPAVAPQAAVTGDHSQLPGSGDSLSSITPLSTHPPRENNGFTDEHPASAPVAIPSTEVASTPAAITEAPSHSPPPVPAGATPFFSFSGQSQHQPRGSVHDLAESGSPEQNFFDAPLTASLPRNNSDALLRSRRQSRDHPPIEEQNEQITVISRVLLAAATLTATHLVGTQMGGGERYGGSNERDVMRERAETEIRNRRIQRERDELAETHGPGEEADTTVTTPAPTASNPASTGIPAAEVPVADASTTASEPGNETENNAANGSQGSEANEGASERTSGLGFLEFLEQLRSGGFTSELSDVMFGEREGNFFRFFRYPVDDDGRIPVLLVGIRAAGTEERRGSATNESEVEDDELYNDQPNEHSHERHETAMESASANDDPVEEEEEEDDDAGDDDDDDELSRWANRTRLENPWRNENIDPGLFDNDSDPVRPPSSGRVFPPQQLPEGFGQRNGYLSEIIQRMEERAETRERERLAEQQDSEDEPVHLLSDTSDDEGAGTMGNDESGPRQAGPLMQAMMERILPAIANMTDSPSRTHPRASRHDPHFPGFDHPPPPFSASANPAWDAPPPAPERERERERGHSRSSSSDDDGMHSFRRRARRRMQNHQSWVIYVIGGTYPPSHPIFFAPSLLTDNPTYEDMLIVEELVGLARPTVASKRDLQVAGGITSIEENSTLLDERCPVCLMDYSVGDECRTLKCSHLFHRECVDNWLTRSHNSCPMCRSQGVPRDGPGSTAPANEFAY